MTEKEPQYFKEFREKFETYEPKYFKEFREKFETYEPKYFKEFREKLETYEPKYFKEFRAHIDSRFDKIEKKQDMHFEAIGEVKVQITEIKMNLVDKANDSDVKLLKRKVDRLDGLSFA